MVETTIVYNRYIYLGCVDEFDQAKPAAKLTIDLKFRSVFSQRSATRSKRLSRPTPGSMRARAL
jgi:hypothetical protein